jgi:hypothetical protein
VGLGGEAPQSQLHVGGDVRVDGAVLTTSVHPKRVHADGTPVRVSRAAVLSAHDADATAVLASGVATLDGAGRAVVVLPAASGADVPGAWASYQLTPLGGPMPSLHVAREALVGGADASDSAVEFEVGGGSPGGRVSWTVTVVAPRP